jgi:Zn-dependent protease with chaperone function
MSYAALLVCAALAVFAVLSVVLELAVASQSGRVEARLAATSAARRARGLFLAAILPSSVAFGIVLLGVVPGFLAFEPRHDGEPAGALLLGLAALGAVQVGGGAWRGLRAWLLTRRVTRAWLATSERIALPGTTIPAHLIEAGFPIVAVVGSLSPRLFVARRVLDACTRDEIAAMVAHETAHVRARDNLKRLALELCADPISFGRRVRRARSAWIVACEDAADDAAAARPGAKAVDLASALVKVARMAPSPDAAFIPASALYRGEDVERRVRRLLGAVPAAEQARRLPWVLLSVPGAFAALGIVPWLRGVHAIVEAAVQYLP